MGQFIINPPLTGISENSEEIFNQLYPNPVNGILNVELKNENNKPMTVSIFNDLGQTISVTKTTERQISIPVN